MRATPALPLLAFLAGCLSPAPTPDASLGEASSFHGGLTASASQADLDELHRLAQAEGWDLLILGGFPMQYQARGEGADACERLRAVFQTKPYVSSVGACRAQRPVEDGDAPTSDRDDAPHGTGDATSSAWGFRGSFSDDHAPADERAVCDAAGQGDACAMMKSDPPQYSFSYPARRDCDDARARVLAVPHVARVTGCRDLAGNPDSPPGPWRRAAARDPTPAPANG